MKLMPGADVWFHPGAHELQLLSDQPLAAKITYVHHSGLVNLIVWGRGGETFQRASVPFWEAADVARDREREVAQPRRATAESDDAYNDRMKAWHRVGYRPTTNYASWIDEGSFDVLEAPHPDDVSHHPFEGRPSGGFEDFERARVAQSRLDARGNMDHGPPPPGLPNPALQGTRWDPDKPAADAKAKADREADDAKAKVDADTKLKAAQADREARMTKWQGEKPQDGG